MKKKNLRVLILSGLTIFLLACNCNLWNVITKAGTSSDGSQNSSDSGNSIFSSSDSSEEAAPKTSKMDGELKIIDQVYKVRGSQILFGLVLENTSSSKTVIDYVEVGNVKDTSGAAVPLLNLQGGDTNEWPVETGIYPGQKGLLCMSYTVPEGTQLGDVSFSLKDVKAIDAGMEPPLSVDSIAVDTKSSKIYQGDIGYVTALVNNNTDKAVWNPVLQAGIFDDSGKIVGCGWDMDDPTFVAAQSLVQTGISVWTKDQEQGTPQVFATPGLNRKGLFKGEEPLQVSNVDFVQVGKDVYPIYTLTNTLQAKTISAYDINLLAFDENHQLILFKSTRPSNIPAKMSIGPYHDEMGQVEEGQKVASLEVQAFTVEAVKESAKIDDNTITFNDGKFVPDQFYISANVKNNANFDVTGSAEAACLDDSGNLSGVGYITFFLAANSETELDFTGGYLGDYYSGDFKQCSAADRIVFNLLSISD
jgi:hypothetical protein